MKNLKSLLLSLGLSVVALGLHATDNAGVAGNTGKTGAGDLATTPALAPVAPVSTPVVAKPAATAPAVAPKAEAPVATTAAAAEEAPATTAGTATVAKKAEKKAGFFKRMATKMKRVAMSTFLLVGIILFGGGLIVALFASGGVGALLMLAGLVFVVLHFIQ